MTKVPILLAVLRLLWAGHPAKGGPVPSAGRRGPPGDPDQGAVLRVTLPTTRTDLPYDGLPQ